MAPAFVTSAAPRFQPSSLSPTALTPRRAPAVHPARVTPRCASVSRPSFSSNKSIMDDDEDTGPQPIHSPEVAAVAVTICEFMNREHVRDIANYVVRFGKKFNDLNQLSQVKLVSMDAAGFTADVVSCDESSCVCVQERLAWPLGLCNNADDIITALKHLSMACGLPIDGF